MTPLIQEMCSRIRVNPVFKWFDISEVELKSDGIYFDQKINHRLLDTKLPFREVALVSKDKMGSRMLTLLMQNSEECGLLNDLKKAEGVVGKTWVLHVDGNFYQSPWFAYKVNEKSEVVVEMFDEKGYRLPDEVEENERLFLFTTLGFVATLIDSLETRETISYHPTRRKNHEKRIRQGKAPLFDWKTVVIEPVIVRRESLGGTHASPRLHDRRGHWRFIKKSQKRIWVKDCTVGNAAKGVVFHDYKVVCALAQEETQ